MIEDVAVLCVEPGGRRGQHDARRGPDATPMQQPSTAGLAAQKHARCSKTCLAVSGPTPRHA